MRVPVIVRVDPGDPGLHPRGRQAPVAALLLKEAGKEKGSGKAKTETVGRRHPRRRQAKIADAKGSDLFGPDDRGADQPGHRHLRLPRPHRRRAGPARPPEGARWPPGAPDDGRPTGRPDARPLQRRDRRLTPCSRASRKVRLKLKDGSIIEVKLEIMNILRAGNDPTPGCPPTSSSRRRWCASWSARRSSARCPCGPASPRPQGDHRLRLTPGPSGRKSIDRPTRPPGDPGDPPEEYQGDARAGYLLGRWDLLLVTRVGALGSSRTSWSTTRPGRGPLQIGPSTWTDPALRGPCTPTAPPS
jgi:hypothetical protein